MNVIKYMIIMTVISVAIMSTIIYCCIKDTVIVTTPTNSVTTIIDDSLRVFIEDLDINRVELVFDTTGLYYIEFDDIERIVAAVDSDVAEDIINKYDNRNNIKFNVMVNINEEYEVVRH